MSRWACVGCLLLAMGCGPDVVPLQLSFPSELSFVLSSSAQVVAVEADADACPELLRQALVGTPPQSAWETGPLSVCSFWAGEVELVDLPEGPMAYVAIARNDAGRPLLAGCRVVDAHEEPEVQVTLAPTDDLRALIAAGMTSECTVDTKCYVGCR